MQTCRTAYSGEDSSLDVGVARPIPQSDGSRPDTRTIVVGGDGSDFSSGFDTVEDIKRLPSHYTGWIWTNRIDRIAPLYRGAKE
jgi:hypothetical protein